MIGPETLWRSQEIRTPPIVCAVPDSRYYVIPRYILAINAEGRRTLTESYGHGNAGIAGSNSIIHAGRSSSMKTFFPTESFAISWRSAHFTFASASWKTGRWIIVQIHGTISVNSSSGRDDFRELHQQQAAIFNHFPSLSIIASVLRDPPHPT